MIKIQFCT